MPKNNPFAYNTPFDPSSGLKGKGKPAKGKSDKKGKSKGNPLAKKGKSK